MLFSFLSHVHQVVLYNVGINKYIPSAQEKIKFDQKLFDKLWKQYGRLCHEFGRIIPMVLEWPRYNVLRKKPKVVRLLNDQLMSMTNFDGCQYGLKSRRNGYRHFFLKKPWAFATNIQYVIDSFGQLWKG